MNQLIKRSVQGTLTTFFESSSRAVSSQLLTRTGGRLSRWTLLRGLPDIEIAYVSRLKTPSLVITLFHLTFFLLRHEKKLFSDIILCLGGVFVLDAYHMPHGCAVWP